MNLLVDLAVDRRIRYLENNYIFGQYTVQRWNIYDRNIDTRTNNYVEGLYFLSRKISNWTQRAPESWDQALVKDTQKTSHKTKILEEKKRRNSEI
jgi:hypothetical protein